MPHYQIYIESAHWNHDSAIGVPGGHFTNKPINLGLSINGPMLAAFDVFQITGQRIRFHGFDYIVEMPSGRDIVLGLWFNMLEVYKGRNQNLWSPAVRNADLPAVGGSLLLASPELNFNKPGPINDYPGLYGTTYIQMNGVDGGMLMGDLAASLGGTVVSEHQVDDVTKVTLLKRMHVQCPTGEWFDPSHEG